jgi:D-arginine dehydrogenase
MMDVAIIGAGMAGASLAAELAGAARILILEAESQPGYHATGRSAAFWSESYGGPLIQPLTSASGPILAAEGFLEPRGAIHLADAGGEAALAALRAAFGSVPLVPLDRAALEAAIPGLKPGWARGLGEPTCADIDVAGLHAFCLKRARANGAQLVTDASLLRAERSGGRWRIETRAGRFEADLIVNAAGAWADEVAQSCGAPPLGIRPYRRTIVQLRVDPPVPADLPLIIDAAGRFYFKPEPGGRLWLSPHDESASAPCDSAPEELDVALAIDRLAQVVDWRIEAVERKWAGLRSFAPDRLPVYGFAPGGPGFFWFAGQGGFGIQTAPAAAALGAALLLDGAPALDPAPYSPLRFAA